MKVVLLIFGVGAGFIWLLVRRGAALFLRIHGRLELGPDRAPSVHAMLDAFSAAAAVPMPTLFAASGSAPAAFVVRRGQRPVVALSETALAHLNPDELAGAIALLVAGVAAAGRESRVRRPEIWFAVDQRAASIVGVASVVAALAALARTERELSEAAPSRPAAALGATIARADRDVFLLLPRGLPIADRISRLRAAAAPPSATA
jgi:hypothetical protein